MAIFQIKVDYLSRNKNKKNNKKNKHPGTGRPGAPVDKSRSARKRNDDRAGQGTGRGAPGR